MVLSPKRAAAAEQGSSEEVVLSLKGRPPQHSLGRGACATRVSRPPGGTPSAHNSCSHEAGEGAVGILLEWTWASEDV